MEDKIYGSDKAMTALLSKEADVCCKNFTIKSSDSFGREAVGIFVRTLDNFSQQDLAKKDALCRGVLENPIPAPLF